jgi:hypothetical protein
MFNVIEKGGDIDAPVVQFTTFGKAAKWLVQCGCLTGDNFEVWYVKRFKTKQDDIWIEAEFEVLP